MFEKLTKKKLEYIVKEETAGSKMYAKLGYPQFAKDEAKHRDYFKGLLSKRY